MTDRLAIANRVRAYRLQQGWIQEQLADRAGVSQSLVAKIERGLSVRDRSLQAVLAVVGASLSLQARTPEADAPERAVVTAARAIPAELEALSLRLLRILPHLPERRLQHFLGQIAIWEEDYGAGPAPLLPDGDIV